MKTIIFILLIVLYKQTTTAAQNLHEKESVYKIKFEKPFDPKPTKNQKVNDYIRNNDYITLAYLALNKTSHEMYVDTSVPPCMFRIIKNPFYSSPHNVIFTGYRFSLIVDTLPEPCVVGTNNTSILSCIPISSLTSNFNTTFVFEEPSGNYMTHIKTNTFVAVSNCSMTSKSTLSCNTDNNSFLKIKKEKFLPIEYDY